MQKSVVTSVSQATRLLGSWARRASSTPSEIWSASLSGCPMLTDSLVNKNLPLVTELLLAQKTAKLLSRRAAGEAAIIRSKPGFSQRLWPLVFQERTQKC